MPGFLRRLEHLINQFEEEDKLYNKYVSDLCSDVDDFLEKDNELMEKSYETLNSIKSKNPEDKQEEEEDTMT